MTTSVKPIPEGYLGATPYLCCAGAAAAIEFYRKAFGATETLRLMGASGKVDHAELKIGNATIMLAGEYPDHGILSPKSIGGSPVSIHIYVADVDALYAQAIAAGATSDRPPADQFYGDRAASLTDPFGHRWMFATHKEDLPAEEIQRRYAAMMNG